jgi:TMEM175 potassium channel family protein
MTITQPPKSEFLDLERLITLIDGVFAVAMTLLVLDLKLPVGSEDLVSALKQLLPGFLVYLIVFASIAGYWTIHYRSFHYIKHIDGRLVVLSLISLLFVTLLPLVTSIVGTHPLDPLATVCLSVNCSLYCLCSWAIWSYAAANRQLLAQEENYEHLQLVAKIMLYAAIGLAFAILLAFVSVYIVYVIWIFYTPILAWWMRFKQVQGLQKNRE